ncbi:PP2C family protein-serine/threonine phosphatase [Arthrobacter sp. ISL-65]|uniref:PP2C family protein-serine/threonine phosphatase n=1 Tax=Arthrobacter sp. ISL-65 TaxID=2819112 RepID=UPI001BEB9504|nr:GAF domain-containing SpoIIE family protein phosphatase [Arthrobacter sp. ISL-65]MBT2551320.1 SpoIIE family protein phosphatase [Arthrobacter sp. ISL-65]
MAIQRPTTDAGPEGNARLRALDSLQLMDTPPEERFDRITRMAREVFSVPIAAVNLLDDEHLFNKSPQPQGRMRWPRNQTFCNVTVQQQDLVVVPDARQDPRLGSLPDVVSGRGVRFYAGRPLSVPNGQRVGTLCLYDVRPRTLDEAERRTLDELGRWAERELQDSAELDRAHEVQQALLPRALRGNRLRTGRHLHALPQRRRRLLHLAGTPGRLDLTLVDVMGKGTAAALMAATIRSAVRAAPAGDPADVLNSVAGTLLEDLDVTGILATAIQATIHTGNGEITYADAGHGLSRIVGPDGNHTRLPAGGLPLGVGEPNSWAAIPARLEPGHTLICFTDGLLDLYGGTLQALGHMADIVHEAKDPASVMKNSGNSPPACVRTMTSQPSPYAGPFSTHELPDSDFDRGHGPVHRQTSAISLRVFPS